MNEVTQNTLKEYFKYSDGNLYRIKTSKTRPDTLGKPFGGVTGNGYIQGWFLGKLYYLHHLIYIYHYGSLPEVYIDHKDGNRLNNKIENLRPVTTQQNMFNAKGQAGSSSKYKGVCWDKARGKWRARIVVNEKEMYLGRYDTEEEARDAYTFAAEELHGEYRRHED